MTISDRIKQPIDPSLCITNGSTPIPYFGQFDVARSCTISLNPSGREFCDKNGRLLDSSRERLCSRMKLGKKDSEILEDAEVVSVLSSCNNYFNNRPYKGWFNKYERFLQRFGLSYYSGSVVHLDLVQWATTPFWGELPEGVRQKLLDRDLPFLQELLKKNFGYIFLNGKTTVTEVSDHLSLKLEEIEVKVLEKAKTKIYFGEHGKSKVLGWSTYLQSAAVGSYANVDRLANEVFEQNMKKSMMK